MNISNESNVSLVHSDCIYCGTAEWMFVGIVTTLLAILGNVLTIFAILLSKKLSSTTANYFVFSLAVSDCFVGCFIPYHMYFYFNPEIGACKNTCLARFSLIHFACSSSICNLVLIAADRYVAIVYPLHYTRFLTKRVACIGIAFGWFAASSMAAMPFIWNVWEEGMACEIFNVLPINYIKFLLCPMFVLIWATLLFLYCRICKEATGHEKRIRNSTSTNSSIQHAVQLKESKSLKMTLMILGLFTACWFPFFIITLYARLSYNTTTIPSLYEIFFNLAMLNSALNPLIYSWKNSNFRRAFKYLLRCKTPNQFNSAHFITNHVPSKKSSLNGISNTVCHIPDESSRNAEFSNVYYPEDFLNGGTIPTISKDIEEGSEHSDDSGLQMSKYITEDEVEMNKTQCDVHSVKPAQLRL